jgi:outer membrane immunogenic protein
MAPDGTLPPGAIVLGIGRVAWLAKDPKLQDSDYNIITYHYFERKLLPKSYSKMPAFQLYLDLPDCDDPSRERSMKKFLLASCAVVLAAPAMAADMMPLYKAPPVAPFTWAGGYLGLHLGGAWSSTAFGDTQGFFLPMANDNGKLNAAGIAGGGQIGWNFVLGSIWLVGTELDVSGTELNGSATILPTPGGGTVGWNDKVDAFGTMRERVGYIAGNWLFYGTGGLGWAHDKFARTQTATGFNAPPAGFVVNETPNPVGWVAGGGVEWAYARNWTAKVEYLHFDLMSSNTVVPSVIPGTPLITVNQNHLTIDTVRVGINYLFN